jgi:predicted transcriptional regulator
VCKSLRYSIDIIEEELMQLKQEQINMLPVVSKRTLHIEQRCDQIMRMQSILAEQIVTLLAGIKTSVPTKQSKVQRSTEELSLLNKISDLQEVARKLELNNSNIASIDRGPSLASKRRQPTLVATTQLIDE